MAVRNHSKKPAWAAERMEKQVKKRLGITRHKQAIVIHGVHMAGFEGTPETVRERWFRHERRTYHFAIKRYVMRDMQGGIWSAYQAQAHDAHHGFALNITGFWGLKPVPIPQFTK